MTEPPRPPELLVVAGEASGDLHGARLVSGLRALVPGLRVFGMGGGEMASAEVELVASSSEISVVGLTEALRVLPRARRVFRRLLHEVDRRRPTTAVLIDAPDFNLRLAAELKRRGLTVVYYVSPQLWAWRRGRVRTIARVVDKMLVLFPFELGFYRAHEVDVVHVGHPLVDEVPVLTHAWERGAPVGEPYRIALLPGSRLSEVDVLLPVMLASVQQLSQSLPVSIRLVRAPTIPPQVLEEQVALSGLPLSVVEGKDRFEAVADSHLALCASGTATLEVGLLETPMVVLYRLQSLTYLFARLMVRLPWVSLVNLVLERPAVPELIQGDSLPANVSATVARILLDPERIAAMRRDLAELRGRLGEPGASARAAREVAQALGQPRPLPAGAPRAGFNGRISSRPGSEPER